MELKLLCGFMVASNMKNLGKYAEIRFILTYISYIDILIFKILKNAAGDFEII